MQNQIDEVMGLVNAYAAMQGVEPYDKQIEAHDAIESKLRELLPVWQPIESAPKDGDHILIHSGTITAIAYWDKDLEKWLESWDGDEEFHDLCKLTNWMPLPKDPE